MACLIYHCERRRERNYVLRTGEISQEAEFFYCSICIKPPLSNTKHFCTERVKKKTKRNTILLELIGGSLGSRDYRMPLSSSVLIPVALARVLCTKSSPTSLWSKSSGRSKMSNSSLKVLVSPDATFPASMPSFHAGWGIGVFHGLLSEPCTHCSVVPVCH